MRSGHQGKTTAMKAVAWKPGTSRWAYLQTSIYTVALVAGLPVTTAVNTDSAWLTFSCVMASGICNVTLAWNLRRHAQRTTASATTAAPQRHKATPARW